MSLYNDLEKTLRSTGYVTGGQASELAHSVEVFINVREAALLEALTALQARLNTLEGLLATANEGTDAMDAEEYKARGGETMAALSDAGLFQPMDVQAIVSRSTGPQARVRLVIDNTGGTIHTAIANHPLDIVILRRDEADVADCQHGYVTLEEEPVALSTMSATGYGDHQEVEHYFDEIDYKSQVLGKSNTIAQTSPS
ncbi:hypothetical protein [Pseudomonas violetae]|uniref:Uncharacterized protein n=1 Tax=Pseudomonas violetae TaxID=2915813 RepID=A0ABT0ET84_9PSED|nr:hypothetical protein [Pseudomonas violetae]MCK1788940.1 hypothetical protein [Pseudomonas violetae]